MKFQLTPKFELELQRLNQLIIEQDYDYYDDMSDEERLIADAGMYVDECYCDNEFLNIEDFANKSSDAEGISPQDTINKIQLLIDKEIIIIN